MSTRDNGVPETPDWIAPPVKPWDADRCCPADCAQACEAIGDNIELGSE